MGHAWWILAAICAAVGYRLMVWHRHRQRRLVVNKCGNYVTPELVEKILAEEDAYPKMPPPIIEATILVTNLTGYVPFCERAGLDASARLINDHFSLIVPVVRKHRGLIVEFVGDSLLCCFGHPRPDDDHARHAARAAIEMQAAQDQLNHSLHQRNLPPVPLRIGIATGAVRAGDFGPPLSYTVRGDAVTEARRLESLCKQHNAGVLISPRTADRIGSDLPLAALPQSNAFHLTAGVLASGDHAPTRT